VRALDRDGTVMDVGAPDAGLWSDPMRAQATMRELSGLRSTVDAYVKLDRRLQDARVLVELADELDDLDSAQEAAGEADAIAEAISEIGEETIFSNPVYYNDPAIVRIAGSVSPTITSSVLFF